jgi:glutamine synthetase
MTPKDVIKFAKEKGVQIVDLRFVDMPGTWQHFSITADELSEDLFAEGIGFDGSSIRGFQTINESDMLLFPDPTTAQLDPFTEHQTLVLICDVKDPVTGGNYSRDPRYVARKAEEYVKKIGLADTVYIGPELEFFIRATTSVFTTSTRRRPSGIRAVRERRIARTWAIARATSRAISRSRLMTTCRTSVPRWYWPLKASGSRSKSITTKWRQGARPKSTCASTR